MTPEEQIEAIKELSRMRPRRGGCGGWDAYYHNMTGATEKLTEVERCQSIADRVQGHSFGTQESTMRRVLVRMP